MKFLTLAALPLALQALMTFRSSDELFKCIQDCEQFVSPCLGDKSCQAPYFECLSDEDPFTCMSSVNSLPISKIVQCFDAKCEQLPAPAEDQTQKKKEPFVNDPNKNYFGSGLPGEELPPSFTEPTTQSEESKLKTKEVITKNDEEETKQAPKKEVAKEQIQSNANEEEDIENSQPQN